MLRLIGLMVHADRRMDKSDMWLIPRCSSHFAENLWPCTIGWLAFPFSEPTLFPHMAHAEKDSAWAFQARHSCAPLTIRLKCAALAIFSSLLGFRLARLTGTRVGCVGIFGGFA